ncbi:PPE domain-containing protein [Nocardia sp. NPDC051463]|uniref:PPE domain-containing protein n=1 Tax=Nocardia sp. NPDC051463 TaxID=3154845 RepID=UPI00341EB2A2
MALEVDLDELVRNAAKLAELARQTGMALPKGWVPPAGTDPISASYVPRLNNDAAQVFNGLIQVLNNLQHTAHQIGAAATDYSQGDEQGAREIGGSGADLVTNPVPVVQPIGLRRPPVHKFPASGPTVDPLTFAQQLQAGPGPTGATDFADSLRQFAGGFHANAIEGADEAANAMQHWRPVGSAAAADIAGHRGWLDQLGGQMHTLADAADTYGRAFRTAKDKHPTPEDIKKARNRLLSAMRSKNQLAIEEALAKFHAQNALSAETISGYEIAVGSKVPEADDSGDGDGKGNGDGEGKGNGNGNGNGAGQGGDSSALMSMLPALMSGMSGLQQPQQDSSGLDDYEDYGLDDYGDYGVPSPASYSGGGGGGGVPSPGAVGAVPRGGDIKGMSATPLSTVAPTGALAGGGSSGLPRTQVIEPLAGGAAGGARGAGAAGTGMAPYMPMSPGGAGGAGGGNDRNRVVAWHPDRLMYVDDTPHTELVIGERPTIAPTVTPPTPGPSNQNSTQSGGTA